VVFGAESMTATPTEAYNDLMALIMAKWTTLIGAAEFEDKPRATGEEPIPPIDPQRAWIRVRLRHTSGKQVTLANDIGSRRFRRYGLLMVQVMSPTGTGLVSPHSHAILINDALEGMATPHDVLIRNVRINEVGSDGQWFQTNVFADIEYDAVK
jgi:hypothetical protein